MALVCVVCLHTKTPRWAALACDAGDGCTLSTLTPILSPVRLPPHQVRPKWIRSGAFHGRRAAIGQMSGGDRVDHGIKVSLDGTHTSRERNWHRKLMQIHFQLPLLHCCFLCFFDLHASTTPTNYSHYATTQIYVKFCHFYSYNCYCFFVFFCYNPWMVGIEPKDVWPDP